MNLRGVINDYVECNIFEMKYKDNKIYVFFYDKIDFFSSDKIIIVSNDNKYSIIGKNLIIEKMYKEELIITGNIKNITFGDNNG